MILTRSVRSLSYCAGILDSSTQSPFEMADGAGEYRVSRDSKSALALSHAPHCCKAFAPVSKVLCPLPVFFYLTDQSNGQRGTRSSVATSAAEACLEE